MDVSILSLDGKMLAEFNGIDSNELLDISHLSKGIYFAHLKIGSESLVKKIVLE